jgi:hypothetical protein
VPTSAIKAFTTATSSCRPASRATPSRCIYASIVGTSVQRQPSLWHGGAR